MICRILEPSAMGFGRVYSVALRFQPLPAEHSASTARKKKTRQNGLLIDLHNNFEWEKTYFLHHLLMRCPRRQEYLWMRSLLLDNALQCEHFTVKRENGQHITTDAEQITKSNSPVFLLLLLFPTFIFVEHFFQSQKQLLLLVSQFF